MNQPRYSADSIIAHIEARVSEAPYGLHVVLYDNGVRVGILTKAASFAEACKLRDDYNARAI